MRARVFAVTLVAVAALLAGQATVAQRSNPPGPSQAPGRRTLSSQLVNRATQQGRVRVIVGLNVPIQPEHGLAPGQRGLQRAAVAAAQNDLLAALPATNTGRVKRFHIIPALAMDADPATLEQLAADPRVAYIEESRLLKPHLAQSAAIVGAPSVWSSGHTGAGHTVAILDSGVDRNHPFFGGRIVSEACYSWTDTFWRSTAICGPWGSTATGAAAPCGGGLCDHGTHVAGIAAGSGTLNGLSMNGVAPSASIIAIQVFSRFDNPDPDFCGSPSPCVLAYTEDIVAGLQRVFDLRNTFSIAAVNMSLGGGSYTDQATCDAQSTAEKAVIDQLRAAGIATVVSSGNGFHTDAIGSPACISSAISVGSTTDSSPVVDTVSTFSNSASFLTLLAPGQSITSSIPVSSGSSTTWQGTSMAAPHVTGAVALLKSLKPSASVTEIVSALTTTGAPIYDGRSGITKPRINVAQAMNALSPPCTFSLTPPSVYVSASATTRTLSVTTQAGCAWTATSNARFITITSGSGNPGPGTVSYSVAANSNAARRTGTMTFSGSTFTVVQAGITPVPPVDINTDGRLDLLWQHQSDGRVAAWMMNGTTMMEGSLLTPAQVSDTNWKVAGAADLDGDGQADLVWHNVVDGRVSAWLMNGLVAREGTLFSIPQEDPNWRVRAVGDVTGDGKADLVWQHTAGYVAVWRLDGLTVVEGLWVTPSSVADLGWQIVGMGDFDGNGTRDLVWHHQTDGRIGIWFMNGTSMTSGSLTTPAEVPDVNWKIRGVGDLDGDGRPDLLWQNVADGRVSVWFMNGLNLISGTLLYPPSVSDTSWHIVAPR